MTTQQIPQPAQSWEPVTETAKRIRQALKYTFPSVKFSVRSDSFALGSSVVISWTDGPTERPVYDVVNRYGSIRRCEITGDILGGGNRYIRCNHRISPDGDSPTPQTGGSPCQRTCPA